MANVGKAQASSGSPNEGAANNKGRRGRSSQSSISDSTRYIGEAGGAPYGDGDDSAFGDGRPLSFLHGLPYQEEAFYDSNHATRDKPHSATSDLQGNKSGFGKGPSLTLSTMGSWGSLQDRNSNSPSSPTLSLREVQEDPSLNLNSIDDPNDIAQELSNLQALRRLSMDVGNSIDPDMPLMPIASMPSIAPRGNDDENDPSRLLWVPARVHPELAPSEFKSFLESRLHSIRRRSGDSFLTVNSDSNRSELGVPSSSLRRKKSMLSRQIDNSSGGRRPSEGYEDSGTVQRQLSQGSQHKTELNLDDLVRDPTKIVQKLTQESQSLSGGLETGGADLPILPIAPGAGLRRSTRTTYRKGGSLRSGDKGSFSRRMAQRQQEDYCAQGGPPVMDVSHGPFSLVSTSETHGEDPSRPKRSVRRQQKFSQDSSDAPSFADESPSQSRPTSAEFGDDRSSAGLSLAQQMASSFDTPASEDLGDIQDLPYLTFAVKKLLSDTGGQGSCQHAETSLDEPSATSQYSSTHDHDSPSLNQSASSKSLSNSRPYSANSGAASGHSDAFNTSPAPSLDERKIEKRSKRDKDNDSFNPSKSSSSWKWFKGGVDDKDRKKEESKKSKSRSSNERTQDNVRLDLIQTSIDKTATKGRESSVIDRDSVDIRLHEDRRKESRRGESKKDKDGSIFSSIFGGGKKKEEKEKHKKNQTYLQVPEEPPYKPLRPDVDYNWTRFPLLEERAIYRLAHIKLANPRRSLHSQVLLSNFMYSYLAIVQAMHPQMNVPISPQQKRLEEEARRKKHEEEEHQAQQEQSYLAHDGGMDDQSSQNMFEHYDYDYSRAGTL